MLPEGQRLAGGRVRRRHDATRPGTQPRKLIDAFRAARQRHELSTTSRTRQALWTRARSRARRHGPCPRHAGDHRRAGRTAPCRATSSATICAISRSCSTSTATRPRSTAISATGSSIAASISTCAREEGLETWQRLPRRGRRSRRRLWRLAVRRARRRPGARRAARDDVRAASCIDAFREFKAIWDPDGRMNPGKVVDPYPITSNLRLGPATSPTSPTTHFAYARGRRQLRQGDAALRRRRRLPAPRQQQKRHVPELHGDRRGEILDPRPRAPAVRDAAWRRHRRRLEERRGRGGARSLPRLQGLQERLPGHMSTWRPTRPSSAATTMPAACGRAPPTRWASSTAGRGSPATCRCSPTPRRRLPGMSALTKWAGGIAPERAHAELRRGRASPRWFRQRGTPGRRAASACCCGRTRSTTTSAPRRRSPPPRCSKPLAIEVAIPQPSALLRPAALRLGHARRGQAAVARRPCEVLADEIAAGTPIVGLEPACVSAFKDELPGLFPATSRPTG